MSEHVIQQRFIEDEAEHAASLVREHMLMDPAHATKQDSLDYLEGIVEHLRADITALKEEIDDE